MKARPAVRKTLYTDKHRHSTQTNSCSRAFFFFFYCSGVYMLFSLEVVSAALGPHGL